MNPYPEWICPLIHHDPSDIGSKIQIRIFPKKRTLNLSSEVWFCAMSLSCTPNNKIVSIKLINPRLLPELPDFFFLLFVVLINNDFLKHKQAKIEVKSSH